MIVATLIAAAGAAVQTGAIPHELSTVLRSRQYDNARVEWASRFYYEVIAPGHGERLAAAGVDPAGHVVVERYHSSKFAGADQLFINYGDAEGCQQPHLKGQRYAYFNHIILDKGQNAWSWRDCVAHVESRNDCPAPEIATPNDVRLLGLFVEPTERGTFDRFGRIEDNALAGSWSVSGDGPLKTVTCAVLAPDRTRQQVYGWVVDTAKGHNCIHAWRKDEGTIAAEAITKLENYNGQWFPRRVTHYKKGAPAADFEVFHAEFGTLRQTEIPLSEMGFPVGFGLEYSDEGGQYVFDGEGFVSATEFVRRAQAGELSTAESMALIDELEENNYGQRPRRGAVQQFPLAQVAPTPGESSGNARSRPTGLWRSGRKTWPAWIQRPTNRATSRRVICRPSRSPN